MTADDIKTKCGIDIRADGELLAALQNSEKLELVNGFWTYKVAACLLHTPADRTAALPGGWGPT